MNEKIVADWIGVDWIGVDWGTSNLRGWAVGAGGQVLAQASSDQGMNKLEAGEFEPALLDLVSDWSAPGKLTRVICCGMVGARQGWVEAPYRTVPVRAIDSAGLVTAPVSDPRLDVRIVPGVKQGSPADVMRGEETQIAGFLRGRPDFDGVLCLPGTHSKWVRISAGVIVSFATYMTGELFALLSERSVLRHSIDSDGWDDGAFDDGISTGLANPARVAAELFSIRAESLIGELPSERAHARLSGLLIGLEIGGVGDKWLGMGVVILGHPRLAKLYQRALRAQGMNPETCPADHATFDGLRAINASFD